MWILIIFFWCQYFFVDLDLGWIEFPSWESSICLVTTIGWRSSSICISSSVPPLSVSVRKWHLHEGITCFDQKVLQEMSVWVYEFVWDWSTVCSFFGQTVNSSWPRLEKNSSALCCELLQNLPCQHAIGAEPQQNGYGSSRPSLVWWIIIPTSRKSYHRLWMAFDPFTAAKGTGRKGWHHQVFHIFHVAKDYPLRMLSELSALAFALGCTKAWQNGGFCLQTEICI